MASTGEAGRLHRWPGLDGVRGVAVIFVVLHHTYLLPVYSFGSLGVTMFFTLSGFLITSLLLDQRVRIGRIQLGSFYLRRARRLLPALLAFMAAVTLLAVVSGQRYFTALDAFFVLAYVGNWAIIGGHQLGGLHHTWSLAVEEQFYLLWPFLVAALARRASGLLYLTGIAAVVSIAVRMLLWEGGEGYDRVYYGFDTRVDALLIGCLLAMGVRMRRAYPSRRAPAGLAVVALAVVGLLAPAGGPAVVFVLMPTAVALLTAVLISSVTGTEYDGWLASKPLVLIGQRSYALYLWHYLCLSFAWRLPVAGVVQAVVGVVLAWTLTAFSWRFVEQPFLRHRVGQEPEKSLARPAPTG